MSHFWKVRTVRTGSRYRSHGNSACPVRMQSYRKNQVMWSTRFAGASVGSRRTFLGSLASAHRARQGDGSCEAHRGSRRILRVRRAEGCWVGTAIGVSVFLGKAFGGNVFSHKKSTVAILAQDFWLSKPVNSVRHPHT